jgi:CheY-like chemotaxis protein
LPTLTTYVVRATLFLLGGKYFKSIAGAMKNEAGFLFPLELVVSTDKIFKEQFVEPEISTISEEEKAEKKIIEEFAESESLENKQVEEFKDSEVPVSDKLEEETPTEQREDLTEESLPVEEKIQPEITEQLETEAQSLTEEETTQYPVDEPPESVSEVEKEEENEFIPPKPQLNLSDLTCLYIEDQVDSQILFKVQMKGLKDIKFAVSFEDAQPMLLNNKFDFIIMDINLQGEYNGLDALKIIKTMPALNSIPIVAVTAYVLPGDKEKFIAAGFDDFISKPIFREKMMESLEKIFLPH